jgi:hypothetical protein
MFISTWAVAGQVNVVGAVSEPLKLVKGEVAVALYPANDGLLVMDADAGPANSTTLAQASSTLVRIFSLPFTVSPLLGWQHDDAQA